MKMNKTLILKAIGLLAFCIPLIASCTPITTPQPEENPLYISKDAQSVVTRVGGLVGIHAQDPEQDKTIINKPTNGSAGGWTKIENDWITIFQSWDSDKSDKVQITVTENNTGQRRTYILGITSKMKKSTLTIIQKGN